MTHSSALKKEKQLRLARNTSKSRKIINIVRKNTRELQNYFISNKSQSTSNEQFTYKTRTFTGPSCQKLTDFLKQKGTDDNNNIHDYYQIIHNSFLLQLMKQTVRIFAGFGHQGLVKLCAILNVPLPTDEDHFSDTLDYLLPTFESYKLRSMKNTVEEACKKSNERKITVSGDGTWQKRGFSSLHGVVEVLSNGPTSKVIDLERLSKKCSICTGLLSIKYSDPKKYSEIKNKHQCEVNHVGSSASMKVAGIHRLFARSKMLYNVKYAHYIGDGDAKVFPKLISDSPYEDVSITKIEDPHHEWCSPRYCGYLQAFEKGEEYDHTAHSLPLKIMKAIRPVFEELAHPPKNRYSTGVMIDLCAAMAVSFYNDGYQSIIPILAELTASESRTTTSSEDFSDDESDGSDNIDSRNINQTNPKSRTNDKSADTPKSLSRSFSTLPITTNANSLNLPLSSLKLTIKPNPLDLPHDQKQRQEIDYKLNQLIFGIRQKKLKTKKKEIYELPPLIKQLIRCLYPSDIDDNNCSQKPDIVFTLRTSIELFRV
ncbi:unnamed protein product [Rotaria magnacalcarata]|uniref:Mutator-like transposase domain-containing protein n=1 Tax=Rotaria magnacalcarata TaxID=392030 RepID=A0A816QYK7_9BILA|nr:unnamed protein product [Rotaria magnacalcarata]